jgi:hypothetical protein
MPAADGLDAAAARRCWRGAHSRVPARRQGSGGGVLGVREAMGALASADAAGEPVHRAGACIARELYGGEVEERPTGRLMRGPRLAAREKRGRVAGLAGLTSVAVRAAR